MQVMHQARVDSLKVEDLQIPPLTNEDIVHVINNSAASILNILEHCIKSFGREKVLY